MNTFDTLKAFILTKYPQFGIGYASVVKVDGTDVILDEERQFYAGITDTRGNYFYIRDMKNIDYRAVQRGAKVAYYRALKSSRIVAVFTDKSDAEIVLKMLLNSITVNGHTVTKSDTEPTRVFKEETGQELTEKNVVIVSVDFTIAEVVSPKNCELNPCKC